jgi:hypothetical protein
LAANDGWRVQAVENKENVGYTLLCGFELYCVQLMESKEWDKTAWVAENRGADSSDDLLGS